MKYDYIMAIDPDCDKSGVALICTKDRHTYTHLLSFPALMDYLKKESEAGVSLKVIVEAGWLNESHWHLGKYDSKYKAAALGNAVGRNHETGRKIIEMCRHYGLTTEEARPLKKMWSGKDGKISQEEIRQFIPGFPARANQEIRDAALLAWNYAGYPIRIKPVGR